MQSGRERGSGRAGRSQQQIVVTRDKKSGELYDNSHHSPNSKRVSFDRRVENASEIVQLAESISRPQFHEPINLINERRGSDASAPVKAQVRISSKLSRVISTIEKPRENVTARAHHQKLDSGNLRGIVVKKHISQQLRSSMASSKLSATLRGKESSERGGKPGSRVAHPTQINDAVTASQRRSTAQLDPDSQRSANPLWREQYDSQQIYNLNKSFLMTLPRNEQMREIKRWHDQDIKGNRLRNYQKEVGKKNACIMTILPTTRLERAHSRTDGHKCLNFRKKIDKFRIHVSDAALLISTSKIFEGFIIVVIGLNCITLAQSDSTKEETPTEKNIDLAFNITYTIEMFLRVFALGFIWDQGAYIRDHWNILDFICVCTAYLEILGSGGSSLAALRAFRVLRPLRFVNNIQGLRNIVSSVKTAIPLLKNTILVLFFFFLIFAIGGLNLFMGLLKQRCVNLETGATYVDEFGDEMICGALKCPDNHVCGKQTLNPNYDVTNFDNIFWALLNVFQCITMEGWSEIMVMYQKAYTPLTFFFFVPMVFIGAFFLLNLTLAVIQSSYSENQALQKKVKQQLQAEQMSLTVDQNKKVNSDEADPARLDSEAGAANNLNIGVVEFYIAQRAVVKMRLFKIRHDQQEEQKAADKQNQAKEDQKKADDEKLKDQESSAKKLMRSKTRIMNSQTILQQQQHDSANQSLRSNLGSQKGYNNFEEAANAEQRENTEELEEKVLQLINEEKDKKIQEEQIKKDAEELSKDSVITEESQSLIEEALSENDVQHFLEKLGPDIKLPFGDNNTFKGNDLSQTSRGFNPVMAFNDIRISKRQSNKMMLTFERDMAPLKGPRRNNLITPNTQKEKASRGEERDLRSNTQLDRLLKELDYDKLMHKKEMLNEQSVTDKHDHTQMDFTERDMPDHIKRVNQDADDMFELEDHPLDLSFTKDLEYGKRGLGFAGYGYASDNDKNEKCDFTKQSLDDFKSSIISSDESSIAAKMQMHVPDLETAEEKVTLRLASATSREMLTGQLKRILTTSELKEKSKMNISQSTTHFAHNPSMLQKQIDCLSSLQPTPYDKESVRQIKKKLTQAEQDMPSEYRQKHSEKPVGSVMSTINPDRNAVTSSALQVVRNRKEKLSIYNEIDLEWFNPDKHTNPIQFINSDKQKVIINPGVPYVSTSQNEIFERRMLKNQKEYLNKINPFIAAPQDDKEQGVYESKKEESYIVYNFDAYQLKTEHQVKKVEEVEWDSDDEDAIVLAQQPYETVMQTGFSNYLNHLNTKFLARRSDIVVSSTISITLTPQDDGFQPAQFAHIGEDEIWEFVMRRQEYRSFQISSNSLKQAKLRLNQNETIDSSILGQSIEVVSEAEPESEEEDDEEGDGISCSKSNQQEIKPGMSIMVAKFRLPFNLLSGPLANHKALLLSKKEKRIYNIQKMKWQQRQKQMEKITKIDPENLPSLRTFKMKDARQLALGTFKHDLDDDDEDKFQPQNLLGEKQKVNLNRAMLMGKNDILHEMALDNFDSAIQTALIDSQNQTSYHGRTGVDPRANGDYVPSYLKDAFMLPKEMSNFEIDYDQVRRTDAMFKRKVPIWSGQEVLDITLNLEKSRWVLSQMNKLRVWPKGFYNVIKRFRSTLKGIVRFGLFDNFLTACVLMNTIVMGMERYDIDSKTKQDLEFLNYIFTWIFIVEMCIKLLAIGPRKYSANVMNLLDGGVVLLSVVEMAMAALGGGGGAGNLQAFRTVRVFRTFRVLRVTRVLRALKSMAMVIGVIQRAMMDFVLITMLMFVFIFIYTLLGRQIFQGKYDFGPDEELPRANFDSFSVAFITVFQVLTMENWQQVLYVSMRASENNMVFKTITGLYYISWIFIGNFILLNLFLAVLIDAFAEEDAEMDDEVDDLAVQRAREARAKGIKDEKEKRMKKLGTSPTQLRKNKHSSAKKPIKKKQQVSFTGVKRMREEDLQDIEEMTQKEIRVMLVENGFLKARFEDQIDFKLVGPEIEAENSIYLFHRNSCFRKNVHFIQKHKWFDNFIMLLIALSSTKLALESYLIGLPEDDQLVMISNEFDFIFNYLFILECVLKIIALGFAMDEGSYMRDGWNKLDFFIVTTSIIDMMLTNTDIPALKVLRMLRMIRPLRVISHNPQLKMIVAALFESVGSIINVSFIVMIIWLMFAIYGMNTFMGMFFYCSEEPYKYNTQWVCQSAGGTWEKFDSNFDDIGQAMLTLFIVASLEGWPDIMYQAIDVTKRDNGPKYEASPSQAGFFVVFILIGSFFFLTFFIGVLFLKYEQAQKKENIGFTKQQLYWLELQRLIVQAKTPFELKYKPLQGGCRIRMYIVAESEIFEVTIMICIVLNLFQMALDHDGASPAVMMFLKVSNYFFTTVFSIEAVLKLYVYRWNYFKTTWNKFDFFVVASSLVDLMLEILIEKPDGGQEDSSSEVLSVLPQLARVMRVMRVTRVLRLVKSEKKLQQLLKTIIMSISSLVNVFILLMLIFFIMAVLGNTMFYMVTEGNVISEYKNFTNFHQSFSLLFSISTGEDWNRIMFDCGRQPPNCIQGATCGSPIASVFFLSFIMIVSNIMLNLFILVIIQQFDKYFLEEGNPLAVFEADYLAFFEAWRPLTEIYQCTKMKTKHLKPFLKHLDPRIRHGMGISENAKEEDLDRIILKMGINVDDGFIHFNEMLYRIMRSQFVTAKKLRFNKVMTVNELVTQFKISEIMLQEKSLSKKVSKEAREQAFFDQHASQPVNLFLTMMIFRTSLIAWRNQMRLFLKKQRWDKEMAAEREYCETIGREFVDRQFPDEQAVKSPVDIEYETMIELSCTDDDEHEDAEQKSKKSGSILNKLVSEWTKSQRQESPELFRLKARLRLGLSVKKFSVDPIQILHGLNELKVINSPKSTLSTRQKHAMIVHSAEEVKATQDLRFVDPNSMEYTNIVLEHKINKHAVALNSSVKKFGSTTSFNKDNYSGSYTKSKLENEVRKQEGSLRLKSSSKRLNAPPKIMTSPQ